MPDRTGSTQRWPSQPRAGLDSLTSDAPCRPLAQPARVRSNQKARIASTTPSSKDAAFTLRSAFHRQVPHPFAFLEPPSGPRLRGSPSSALETLHHRVFRGCSPRTFGRSDDAACQLLQSPRFLSTTPDVTITLRAWLRVAPRLCSCAGGVASFDALPVELSSVQGPAFAFQRRRHLPRRSEGALPRP